MSRFRSAVSVADIECASARHEAVSTLLIENNASEPPFALTALPFMAATWRDMEAKLTFMVGGTETDEQDSENKTAVLFCYLPTHVLRTVRY